MLTRRFAVIVVAILSLLVPIGLGPTETHAAGSETGFKGTVRRLPNSSLARNALKVLAINPNRATVVDSRGLNEDHRYRMTVPAGLYMVGANGLRTSDGFTHAKRLRKGQMLTVDLPPGTGAGTMASRSVTSIHAVAAGAPPVVTVGPIPVHGISDLREGADLWSLFDYELEIGSRPRCKVTYTSDQIRALVRQELRFQQTHNVDPSTRIEPNLVTPTARVSGSITQTGSTVTISLTERDLATGDVNQTESVSGPKSSFFDLVERIGRKVGRNLCPRTRITGTITYNETSSDADVPCCSDQENLDASIDVVMRSYGGNFPGFENNGSSYSILYSLSSSGEQADCNYQGTWDGSGGGPLMVHAGKLIEPGDTSPLTGEPAETYELVVGVETGLDYTYSGSETFSSCANPSNNVTIPHGDADTYLDDVYEPCEGVTGLLEFKSTNATSKTLVLHCSETQGDTTYTLDGTLTVED